MPKNTKTRTDKDFLGNIAIPKEAYFSSHTARAKENFQISGLTAPDIFKKALGITKLAAIKTNAQLKLISPKKAKAIEKACQEFINGKFDNDFTLDALQAGAGTPYNMNANEIIANRANELLGGKKGQYEHIHPNNHVNMAQSSNDLIPTATRIAVLQSIPPLISELKKIEVLIGQKQKLYKDTLKVGRTHLQDAVPITVGQELDSYRQAIKKSQKFIEREAKNLQVIGIGGTAVGTGITSDPKFKNLIIKNLSKLTGIHFKKAKNSTEIANNMNAFLNVSAALRSLAINLLNISSDLKIMNSGPQAGLREITLPAVQPGSSIMPGKVNPSILECVDMICAQVLGNDKTIEISAQKSQFELNVMCPIIMYNLLQSTKILTNGVQMLRDKALKDFRVNKKRIRQLFENSNCIATALVPHIGYEKTAEIVKEALEKKQSIKQTILKKKLFSEQELQKIFSVEAITNPLHIKRT
ncbi:aspartate ammonia-lyase [Patescibacteria group bacterium]|nr:aspartate ammonia-lyase [Patescibacteria group bacterium]